MLSDKDLDDRLIAYFEAEALHAPALEATTPTTGPSRSRRGGSWRAIAPVATAAAVVAGLLLVPSVFPDSDPPTGSPETLGSPTGNADRSGEVIVYTYRLMNNMAHARVAPVRVAVDLSPTSGTEERIARAVQALLDYEPSNDTASPWDDELSVWDKNDDCAIAGGVRTVTVTDNLITIDLTSEGSRGRAACTLNIPALEMQGQQIAWTVSTASDTRTPVEVTIDGASNELGPGPFTPDPAVLDDLVAVRGDAGEDGFVYQEQLDSVGRVRTPAEAMVREKEVRDGAVDLTLPVYQADGLTQIDTFTLAPGSTSTTDHEGD